MRLVVNSKNTTTIITLLSSVFLAAALRQIVMERKSIWLQFALLFCMSLFHSGCASIKVRLNSTNSSSEGRVEVQYRGVWGTICDDYWSLDNAHVVCRMLGFARAFISKGFGPGTGKIWLDDVSCKGSETSIDKCRHGGWGSHNCHHNEDVGVVCTNGDPNITVRLAHSSFPHAGQLEIRYHGIWKPVCDDYWSFQDAHVVCRMLNYTDGAALALRGFHATSGDVWEAQISCSGTEVSIDKCEVRKWGISSCSNNYRAGVVCLIKGQVSNVAVRLVNGSTPNQGRVQLRYYGVWGTVCHYNWGIGNAHVACHMLNYSKALNTSQSKKTGSGPILLLDSLCSGFEDSLETCSTKRGWNFSCSHNEDVEVTCEEGPRAYPDLSVRLVSSSLAYAGQIEMRYYGVWKPVCYWYWSKKDANVVCRMLGYSQGAALALRGHPGRTSDAWDVQMRCSGTETSIDKCRHLYWRQSNCHKDYRISVVCLRKGLVSNVAVRLVNGSTPNQGRVQLRYYGVWGTVCHYNWGIGNAHVACHMLNYSKALSTSQSKKPGSGPILPLDSLCSGFEDSVENCWKRGWHATCGHYGDAEVTCGNYGTRAYPDLSVRLVNSSFANAGQIEIRYYNVWKPVCDGYWTKGDADVACRMMGYRLGSALSVQGYGITTSAGDVWSTHIRCSGSETSFDKCRLFYWKQTDCHNDHRAGVVCLTSVQDPKVAVRLVDGSTPNQGRLEVRYYGVWGTVCDDYWRIANAHVVCRMLNYSKALTTGTSSKAGSGAILLDNVYCSGYENSLESCINAGWGEHNCGHFEDVHVSCANETKGSANVAVRLISGSSPNEGRVEVRYYGVWGTVCDDNWGLADAHVVCRMLNYSRASWAGTAKSIGSGPIALDEVQCRGKEKSIEHCTKNQWGSHNCYHFEDAGVKCEKLSEEESNVTARLFGTNSTYMGIVEVNYKGIWRLVCDDTWDILDAHVICRMLGYNTALLGIKGYRVRKASTPCMGNVECSGDEKLVSECYHRGWASTWCPGKRYAGVMCNVENGFPPVQVRLEDGNSPASGRVAVRYGNVWGTVCYKGLNDNAATVICRMLGYPGSHYTYNFKPGIGVIWLMSLECKGTEKSIIDCSHPGWGNIATCDHDNDLAIMCKKADAPEFQINGTDAITESTVLILFTEAQPSIGVKLKNVYQVAVEKLKEEKNYQSAFHTIPSVFIDDVNVTLETSKFNDSYITAEIIDNSSKLTIGDGQNYNGYYNALLEPGCRYRVYVRAVTRTIEKKPIYSDTSFVTFTTKRRQANANKAESGTQAKPSSLKDAVIGLSVVIFGFILVGIALCCYLRKNRDSLDKRTIESDGGQREPTPHYHHLSPATRTNTESQANIGSDKENEPSTPHYQSPPYPATRANTQGEQREATPHYQPLFHPSVQRSTAERINGEATPHYQSLPYPAKRDNTQGEQREATPHYQSLFHPSVQRSTTERINGEATSHYQPLSYPATRGQQGDQRQDNRLSYSPHYQPLSRPSTQDNPRDADVLQNRADAILKKMYRKKIPETSNASVATESNGPSFSTFRSLSFRGIENQAFSMSDIRLQELSSSQTEQES